VRQAVWSCYQETPTAFREYTLSDPGAWPDEALCGRITWRVTRPEAEPKDEEERRQVQKLKKPGSILSSKHGIAKVQM